VDLGADELELDAPSDHVPERVEVARHRLLEVLLLLPPHRQRRPHRHLLRLLRPALRRRGAAVLGRRRQLGHVLADGRDHLSAPPRPPPLLPAVERREAELARAPAAARRWPRQEEASDEVPAWRGHVALPLGLGSSVLGGVAQVGASEVRWLSSLRWSSSQQTTGFRKADRLKVEPSVCVFFIFTCRGVVSSHLPF
jgi:hypothetical protein